MPAHSPYRVASLRTLTRESAKVPRRPMGEADLPAPRRVFYIANSFTSVRREAGSRVLRSGTTVFDLSAKRELNNGFGNALSTAVELAVTPALMALVGWQIDRWLGTSPLFLLFLFVFTVAYVSWREYTRYSSRMDRQERELLGGTDDRR
jgi:F0F1-type ATP synthase assembly protein I